MEVRGVFHSPDASDERFQCSLWKPDQNGTPDNIEQHKVELGNGAFTVDNILERERCTLVVRRRLGGRYDDSIFLRLPGIHAFNRHAFSRATSDSWKLVVLLVLPE